MVLFNKNPKKEEEFDTGQNLKQNKPVKTKKGSQNSRDIEYVSDGMNYLYERMKHYMSDEVEISDKMNNIADLSYETGNKIENIYRNMEKNSREFREFTEFYGKISTSLSTVENSVDKAGDNVQYLSESLYKSQEEMLEIQKAFTKLENDFKNISKYVKNINGIAHTTHLLSLNASVEAAKAGEFGTGFTVVADHIEKLSDSTKSMEKSITKSMTELYNSIDALRKEIDDSSIVVEKSLMLSEDLKNSYKNIVLAGDRAKGSVEQLDKIVTKSKSNQNILSESLDSVSESVGEIDTEILDLGEKNSEKSISLGEMVDIILQFLKLVEDYK
ncbi:MAG: hypothetical protein K6D02_09630 [Lachnospiraceae bacterium]|nr:hypothetical protein [Lachnospiraceae bacterium]